MSCIIDLSAMAVACSRSDAMIHAVASITPVGASTSQQNCQWLNICPTTTSMGKMTGPMCRIDRCTIAKDPYRWATSE